MKYAILREDGKLYAKSHWSNEIFWMFATQGQAVTCALSLDQKFQYSIVEKSGRTKRPISFEEFRWRKGLTISFLFSSIISFPICFFLAKNITVQTLPSRQCILIASACSLGLLLMSLIVGLPYDLKWRQAYTDQVMEALKSD